MPTVPANQNNPTAPRQRMVQVDPVMLAAAAADLHSAGRLFEERAAPVIAAVADGTIDPVGANYTDFKGRK